MYKIFKITYNDGGWHSGSLPHAYYIAKSEEEVIANSKQYAKFLEYRERLGGSIWIREVNGPESTYDWENIKDFEVSMTVKERN